MKAVATERPRVYSHNILGVKKDSNCSIMKNPSIEFKGEKFTLSEEMRECFLKLSDMVPVVPRDEAGNIDGTTLMQNVIDYILDLELQLDYDKNPLTSAISASFHQAKFYQDSREPLSEKIVDNIAVSNQVPSSPCHTDSLLSRTTDDIRPPSK